MSLKAKLVSSIAAFCLVLALMVVGIFAANSLQVNLSGNLTYTATDVVAEINVSSTGAKGDNISWNSSVDATDDELTGGYDALNLEFAKDTPIVITVTVKNNSNENMTVTATQPTAASGVTIQTSVSGGSSSTYTEAQTVSASQTVTYTITLTMQDTAENNDITGTWGANFTLAR